MTSSSQLRKKVRVLLLRMMPCFFRLGSPLSFRPIIGSLDRKKDSLSSSYNKKALKKVEEGCSAQHVPTCHVKPFWLETDSDQSFIGSWARRKLATSLLWHMQTQRTKKQIKVSFIDLYFESESMHSILIWENGGSISIESVNDCSKMCFSMDETVWGLSFIVSFFLCKNSSPSFL